MAEANPQDLIIKGNHMIGELSKLSNVEGVSKLVKNIQREIEFLEKVSSKHTSKENHLKGSNMCYFEAIVSCALLAQNCQAILKSFTFKDGNKMLKRICVDIVAECGYLWIKVSSRDSKALTLVSLGQGRYNQRNMLNFANDFLLCASQHPFNFITPKVMFHYAQGIEAPLAKELEACGIHVSGEILDDTSQRKYLKQKQCGNFLLRPVECLESLYKTVNLDVSTIVAYISSISNGGANFTYKDGVLNEQAKQERQKPLKPQIETFLSGKTLICCETAVKKVQNLVDTIGGPNELMRLQNLLLKVTIVPDASPNYALKVNGKIKEPTLTVFSTGYAHKAITISANKHFHQAALHQGVAFPVLIHRPCSLSERKECQPFLLDSVT